MKKLCVVFGIATLLGACAAPTPPPSPATPPQVDPVIQKLSLGDVALADLQAAAADATAKGDVVAAQCWNGLIPIVGEINTFLSGVTGGSQAAPIGVFTTFQDARDLKALLGALAGTGSSFVAQVRQQINLACGALFVDVNAGLVDPLSLLSGPVGNPVPVPALVKKP